MIWVERAAIAATIAFVGWIAVVVIDCPWCDQHPISDRLPRRKKDES